MKNLVKYITGIILFMYSIASQAMTVWVVESGQGVFSNLQDTLLLSAGTTTTLDLYYDVEGDTSYGYDLSLDIAGDGSISNVGGGDSDLGDFTASGWRQFGGDIYGENGSTVLAFSFDFTAGSDVSLLASGSYTGSSFTDVAITSSTVATVSAVPVPAAVWLFGSGLLGLAGVAKRKVST